MGRAGHGILGHAGAGREIARDEIAVVAGCCRDHGEAVERGDTREIGLERAHVGLAGEDGEAVARRQHLAGRGTERAGDIAQIVARRRRARREIHPENTAVARHDQRVADLGLEGDAVAPGHELGEDDVRGRQCRMAGQIDLDGGREPAQAESVALALVQGYEERGLRQIVLGGDRLHRRVGQPGVERAHCRRIAGEHAVGEGIDLVDRNLHGQTVPLRLKTRLPIGRHVAPPSMPRATVMVGFRPTIHAFFSGEARCRHKKTWMVATSATMTMGDYRCRLWPAPSQRLTLRA
jgi:hypothetical protein